MSTKICIFSALADGKELCEKFNQIEGVTCTLIEEYTTNKEMRAQLGEFDVVIVLPLIFDQWDEQGTKLYLDNLKLISYAISLKKIIYAVPVTTIESRTTVKAADKFFGKLVCNSMIMIFGETNYDEMKEIIYIQQAPSEKIVSKVCKDFFRKNEA